MKKWLIVAALMYSTLCLAQTTQPSWPNDDGSSMRWPDASTLRAAPQRLTPYKLTSLDVLIKGKWPSNSVEVTLPAKTTIVLKEYIVVPAGKRLMVKSAVDTPIADYPTIVFKTATPSQGAFKNFGDIEFRRVSFDGQNGDEVLLRNQGSSATLRQCYVRSGGGLVMNVENGKRLAVIACWALKYNDNFIFAGTGNTEWVYVKWCKIGVSRDEHCIRLHLTKQVFIDECLLDNAASPSGKNCLNFREVENGWVRNTEMRGLAVVGPLPIDETPNRKSQLVVFTKCKLVGLLQLLAGAYDVRLEDCTLIGNKTDACIAAEWNNRGDRRPPFGSLYRVTATYAGGNNPRIIKGPPNFKMKEVTFNGKAQ